MQHRFTFHGSPSASLVTHTLVPHQKRITSLGNAVRFGVSLWLGATVSGCSEAQQGDGNTTTDSSSDATSQSSTTTPTSTTTANPSSSTGVSSAPSSTGSTTSTPTGSTTSSNNTGATGQTSETTTSTNSGQSSSSASDTTSTAENDTSSSTETSSAATSGSDSTTSETSGSSSFDGKELFILFGQSNMSGSAPVEEQDKATNENITFMVQYDCPSLNQTAGEWLVAQPPLHGCQWTNNGVLGLGPADYFAKTLAESWSDSKIGLVPCAIPGVSIDVFLKNAGPPPESYQALPPGFSNAYAMMLERATAAKEQGRIRGILFHQGESNCGQNDWVGKVASIVSDLRTDLELGEDVPFIAGEIPPANSCSQSHNPKVNEIPAEVPNSAVVSAQGTTIHDQYHFDSASARLMGERYAEKFLELVPAP